jgi:predicted transcriptional regulator
MMNLTLHLTPATEAKLREQASLAGRSPEELALEALQDRLAVESEPCEVQSPGSRLAEFRAWLASRPVGNPDADFSRESIYGDRGE